MTIEETLIYRQTRAKYFTRRDCKENHNISSETACIQEYTW